MSVPEYVVYRDGCTILRTAEFELALGWAAHYAAAYPDCVIELERDGTPVDLASKPEDAPMA